MTVDIARMDHNAVAVLGGANDALDRLGAWVQAAKNATALVAPLIDTPFIPDAYRPKVDPRATAEEKDRARGVAIANATAAVLQGISLGVDPLVSLQQIYIVHGRPGMYAKMMVALVQAHGHDVWDEEGECTDTRAVVYGRRKGSEHTIRVIVTMEQARKAGWTSNQAYAKTPADMLWNRAAARVCDRIASDVIKGIASVEQINDEVFSTKAELGNGHRTVSPRRRQPAIEATTVDDPPLEEEQWQTSQLSQSTTRTESDPADPAEPTATPTPQTPAESETRPNGNITAAQQRMLHALLRDTDRGDRDVALVYIAGILGREIESTKELSKADASKVIDALNGETSEAQPPLDEQ